MKAGGCSSGATSSPMSLVTLSNAGSMVVVVAFGSIEVVVDASIVVVVVTSPPCVGTSPDPSITNGGSEEVEAVGSTVVGAGAEAAAGVVDVVVVVGGSIDGVPGGGGDGSVNTVVAGGVMAAPAGDPNVGAEVPWCDATTRADAARTQLVRPTTREVRRGSARRGAIETEAWPNVDRANSQENPEETGLTSQPAYRRPTSVTGTSRPTSWSSPLQERRLHAPRLRG
jgi:hypothetical protein